ncbi:hypothetical protein JB92DRAFT_2824609 [Gautieria morchelliformis]|nr:hypothetical protein JB92DRAFT_2824609 [Gautieria morchelliformis]
MPLFHDGETLDEEIIERLVLLSRHSHSLTSTFFTLFLAEEVRLMWHRPYQFASILFFLSRYLPFVGMVFDLATMGLGTTNKSSVVLVIQTYAFYNHNRVILVTLSGLGLATIIEGAVEKATNTCSLDPPDYRPLRTAISVVASTVFPTIVLPLTLWKTFVIVRQRGKFQGNIRGAELTTVLVFQGFCMSGVCVLHLLNVLWYFTDVNLGVNPFTSPIFRVAAIFTAHLLMSLRAVSARPDRLTPSTNPYLTTVLCTSSMNAGASNIQPVRHAASTDPEAD